MVVEHIVTDNVRNIRIMINDELCYIDKTFKIHENDNVRIKIVPLEVDNECNVKLMGYNPNIFFDSNNVPEKVFDEEVTHEDINIE